MIIKPIKDYSPTELYLLDQYIMNGGKVIWLIDMVNMEIDSFRNYKEVMAVDYGLENIRQTNWIGWLSLFPIVWRNRYAAYH